MSTPTLAGWSNVAPVLIQVVAVRATKDADATIDLHQITDTAWWTAINSSGDMQIISEPQRTAVGFYLVPSTFNKASKTGTVIVKLPYVPTTGTVVIWIFAGGTGSGSNVLDVISRLPDVYDECAEVGRWFFNDLDGFTPTNGVGQVFDNSIYRNSLAIHGTHNYTTRNSPGFQGTGAGFAEKILTLGASSGFVTADTNAVQRLQIPAWTFVQWFYFEGSPTADSALWNIFDNDLTDPPGDYASIRVSDTGKFQFSTTGGGTGSINAVGTTTVVSGQWYLVAVSLSTHATKLYVNGALEASSTTPGSDAFHDRLINWKGMSWCCENRFVASTAPNTPNTYSTSLGPAYMWRAEATAAEIAAAWQLLPNPIQIAPRRKMVRGTPIKPDTSGNFENTIQEASILSTPNDPDGYPYTITHTTGFSAHHTHLSLEKAKDPMSEWVNCGLLDSLLTAALVAGGASAPPNGYAHCGSYAEGNTVYITIPVTVDSGASYDIWCTHSSDGCHTFSPAVKLLDHSQITGESATTICNPVISKLAGGTFAGKYILVITAQVSGIWEMWITQSTTVEGTYTALNGGAFISSITMPVHPSSVDFRGRINWSTIKSEYQWIGSSATVCIPLSGPCVSFRSTDLINWTQTPSDSYTVVESDAPRFVDQNADNFLFEYTTSTGAARTMIVSDMFDNTIVGHRQRSELDRRVYAGTKEDLVYDGSVTQLASPTTLSVPTTPAVSAVVTPGAASSSVALTISSSSATVSSSLLKMTIVRDGVAIATAIPYATSYVDASVSNGVTHNYSVVVTDPLSQSSSAGTASAVVPVTSVALVAGSIDLPTFTANALASLSGYGVSTNTTTPATADTYLPSGIYNRFPTYTGLAHGYVVWYSGSIWTISTATGVTTGNYWLGGPNASGVYSAAGTASGSITLSVVGNLVNIAANQQIKHLKLHAGTTSVSLPIYLVDNTGAGLGGLAFNTPGLVAEYQREGQSAWTSIPLVSGTAGTYVSGGFVAIGTVVGDYQLSIPDAAIATGARFSAVRIRGAGNMRPVQIDFELDAVNYQSQTNFITGMSGIAMGANGGPPTGDANGNITVGGYAPNKSPMQLPNVQESDWTDGQLLHIIACRFLGESSANGTIIKNLDGSKVVITATVDGSGSLTTATIDKT